MRVPFSKLWNTFRKTWLSPLPRSRSRAPARHRLEIESLEQRLTPSAVGVSNSIAGAITGHAYVDANHDGLFGAGDTLLPGVTVTLTGTTTAGQTVTATVKTNASGTFNFRELQAGTYTITRSALSGFTSGKASFGTLGGTPAGNAISAITLNDGQVGLNYNFGMFANLVGSGVSLIDFTGTGQTFTLPPPGGGLTFSDGSVQPTT